MVAGIIAANTNNGLGVTGVTWNGQVMPIKVFLDGAAGAFDSDVAVGIRFAADHGAKVINLSLGGPGDSPVLHDAITYATSRDVVVVVASGNTSDNVPQFPAAYPEVLAVGATDATGALTDFSSWGDWLDVAAPGFHIVSTFLNNRYAVGDGTSFAARSSAGSRLVSRVSERRRWGIDCATRYDAGPAESTVPGWGWSTPRTPSTAALDSLLR
jgi:subtilisin family serine protease